MRQRSAPWKYVWLGSVWMLPLGGVMRQLARKHPEAGLSTPFDNYDAKSYHVISDFLNLYILYLIPSCSSSLSNTLITIHSSIHTLNGTALSQAP
jgi:hypothetical protein